MIALISLPKNVHKSVFCAWQASPSLLKLNQFRTALYNSTLISSVFVSCWPKLDNNSEDIFFCGFFISFLFSTFIKAARMLDVSLPILLSVKTLIFYFSSVSSSLHDFHYILWTNRDTDNPCKLCYFFFLRQCHIFFCYGWHIPLYNR